MGREGHKNRFISEGEVPMGMSDNIISTVNYLAHKKFCLFEENGNVVDLDFLGPEALRYTESGSVDKHAPFSVVCGYRAYSPREHIYFLDLVVSHGSTKSVSVILDTVDSIATIITAVLPTAEKMSIPLIDRAKYNLPLTAVNLEIRHAKINAPFSPATKRHMETSDLIGKRILFSYSASGSYEHIYLNRDFYCWHCIEGSAKGLSDTDRCYYLKIAEYLYCFIWIEKIIPTLGVVLEDLDVMRTYGKLYGYDSYETGEVSNFAIGSYAAFLNQTEYPESKSIFGTNAF
ncbi:MoaF C-terminal domain-containing protein [Sporolactobacillus pectinivorans]|uniref:MoaF C-terminal domain-containing protein n=1 Tax=Sporolactobacillus pectinivorans TaxID=1591408 RepID=UPI000C265F48|nr:MoaF C-terminal domain-containing protein [Sporolactobacillus pectinivorans]